jgi:hypothetical protein
MTRTPKRPRDPNLMRTGRLGGPAVSRMDGSTCLSIATLSAPQNATAQRMAWLPVAYWGDDHQFDGLSVDPALGPPIII